MDRKSPCAPGTVRCRVTCSGRVLQRTSRPTESTASWTHRCHVDIHPRLALSGAPIELNVRGMQSGPAMSVTRRSSPWRSVGGGKFS